MTDAEAARPSRAARLAIALAIGVASATYVVAFAAANPDWASDFDQVWGGGRALLDGESPYEAVGPGRKYPWSWPFYYPLPAVLVTVPFALLPLVAARAAFAGVSAALLAWAVTRDGFGRLPLFISISFVTGVELVQWGNLLTAAMLMPTLGWLAVAKPNLGIAMVAHSRSNRELAITAAGALVLIAASFAIRPTWAHEWLAHLDKAPQFRPLITRPLGLVPLLALLRWRRPEGRFLAALAFVPRTPTFYDHVFLFAAARTFRESLALTVGTFAVFFFMAMYTPFPDLDVRLELLTKGSVWFVYLPAVILVLRRPNEGELPAVVHRVASRIRTLFPFGPRSRRA